MVPLATLHHFVHPQWFEDLGGFEKEANITHFLSWTELAYRCAAACPSFWTDSYCSQTNVAVRITRVDAR